MIMVTFIFCEGGLKSTHKLYSWVLGDHYMPFVWLVFKRNDERNNRTMLYKERVAGRTTLCSLLINVIYFRQLKMKMVTFIFCEGGFKSTYKLYSWVLRDDYMAFVLVSFQKK
eukprot:TRINITY_DN613_c0_g1_i1.p4 TRINITY_DN613_c0_g1~~TRINITY_DN613_c0_g1_i1.p4  ORF type:complete len:113 (-),score=8.56 TRINITY_DN613_c0_g1_i1:404-742(-)